MHEEVCCPGAQDLELDIPDAAHFVALFLGRATVDEVLPPAFLTAVLQRLHDDSLGVQVVRSVGESAQPPSAQHILVSGLQQIVGQVPGMQGALISWSMTWSWALCCSWAHVRSFPLLSFLSAPVPETEGNHLRELPFCLLALTLAHLRYLPQGTCWAPSMRPSACSAAGRTRSASPSSTCATASR